MLIEVVNATLIILFVELFCVRVQLMSNGDWTSVQNLAERLEKSRAMVFEASSLLYSTT